MKPFLEYIYQRVHLHQCVPSTRQTHDYGYYVKGLFPLFTGEVKSGNVSLLAEYNKCILGMTHALNVYPQAAGMASTVNQVDFSGGNLSSHKRMKLNLEKHPLHLTGTPLQSTQNPVLLSSNMLV